MNNKFRNKKGITLIALVLTIIILLILAGIALATLSGNILKRGTQTKEKTEQAGEKELIQTAVYGALTENLGGEIHKVKIKKQILVL